MLSRSLNARFGANDKRGFTLVELLVVIAIIGIIAVVLLINFSTVRKTGRDSARVTDVTALRDALEIYQSDNRDYPLTLGALVPTYLPNQPKDPLDEVYHYSRNSASEYMVWAQMENQTGGKGVLLNDTDIDGTGWLLPEPGVNGANETCDSRVNCIFDYGVK